MKKTWNYYCPHCTTEYSTNTVEDGINGSQTCMVCDNLFEVYVDDPEYLESGK